MDRTQKRSTLLLSHPTAHDSATWLPPHLGARESGNCRGPCALEESGNDFENSPSVPATEVIGMVVKMKLLLLTILWKEGNQSPLDLSGLRTAQDDHHFHVCASVSVQRCECVSFRDQNPRQNLHATTLLGGKIPESRSEGEG